MCRVTLGHLRGTVGHPWVTIGDLRVTFSLSKHKANTTELHPKVRQTCYVFKCKYFFREPNWDQEISDDVMEECNKHGGVHHIYVDKASPQGNVYVKCPNIGTAVAAVNALHGRWFAGQSVHRTQSLFKFPSNNIVTVQQTHYINE